MLNRRVIVSITNEMQKPPRCGNAESKRRGVANLASKKIESVIHADGIDISVITTVGNEEDYIGSAEKSRFR